MTAQLLALWLLHSAFGIAIGDGALGWATVVAIAFAALNLPRAHGPWSPPPAACNARLWHLVRGYSPAPDPITARYKPRRARGSRHPGPASPRCAGVKTR